ncbi:helix-turn-helix domain-containing protein [Rhizobium sp. BK376]|uniref:helix-turn-helix domain-containing protein n=1 Tax=Rhizobium sp. BK376 TaxID=2512149 RepID=UPI00104D7415|nr:helix-turn-helix domain-containing protein [Rhizobium sp. BK376]TCR85512.1 helix-turn-helix protein [Rhizobium sp. BK376]
MNVLSKTLLGKTILSVDNTRGLVVALDYEIECYVIRREDAVSRGWDNPTVTEMVSEQSPDVDLSTLKDRCWYVSPRRVAGQIIPVELVTKPETVVPVEPIEPTAPMTASVLKMLREKGNVTALEAEGVLRCRSLNKRISELKALGHKITRTLQNDHTGQRYARYIYAAA